MTQKSMGNPRILNVSKFSVLQQHYGINIDKIQLNIIRRVTYGYNKGRNMTGTEPSTYITKTFDKNIYAIASYIQILLHVNRV